MIGPAIFALLMSSPALAQVNVQGLSRVVVEVQDRRNYYEVLLAPENRIAHFAVDGSVTRAILHREISEKLLKKISEIQYRPPGEKDADWPPGGSSSVQLHYLNSLDTRDLTLSAKKYGPVSQIIDDEKFIPTLAEILQGGFLTLLSYETRAYLISIRQDSIYSEGDKKIPSKMKYTLEFRDRKTGKVRARPLGEQSTFSGATPQLVRVKDEGRKIHVILSGAPEQIFERE